MYQNALSSYVKRGLSHEYILSSLWASFSKTHSISQIDKDVLEAIKNR